LLTVHHIVITVTYRTGLQRGQVGTGARLGITLTPPVLTGQDARQILALLLFGTELDDHRSDHVDAEGDGARCTGSSTFLVEDVLLNRARVAAVMFNRPTRCIPARAGQDLLPALVVFFGQVLAVLQLAGDGSRQFLLKEITHLITEGDLYS